MSLKGKSYFETGLFLDLQVDEDQITFCNYRVLPKDEFRYRETDEVSLQAFTGKDEPATYSEMPAVQHGEALIPAHFESTLVINGEDIGSPDVFLIRQSQITFKFVDNDLMRPNQADTYSNWYLPMDNGAFGKPYNWYSASYIGKDSGFTCKDYVLAQISAPYFNAPISECAVRINVDPKYGYRSNVSFDNEILPENDGFGSFIKQTMPIVEFTSTEFQIEPNGTIQVPFELNHRVTSEPWDREFTAFLECTAGYLPKQRVLVQNGAGSFKVTALGLDSGDEFKVKIGSRFYTGINEVNFVVL